MPQPNWLVQVGLAKEPAWGTTTNPPTASISVDAPAMEDPQDAIYDQGLRGVRSKTHAMTFGAGHSEHSLPDMPYYADDTGHFLMGMMGTDTIAGTARTGTITSVAAGGTSATYTPGTGGASVTGDIFLIDAGLPTAEIVIPTSIAANVWTVPASGPNSFKFAHGAGAAVKTLFSHTLTVLNTASPPSYTFYKFDNLVATCRQWSGVYLESLNMKWVNPGKFTVSAKAKGKLGVQVTKPTFPAYSTEPFNVPWQATFTIGGVANARVVSWELDLAAPNAQIFGMNGTQSPTAAVPDQLDIMGKFVIVPDDYTEFVYYTANTQPAVSFYLDNGSSRTTFQTSKLALKTPTILDHKGDYTLLNGSYTAIDNATDAGTGNAAVKVVIYNSRATAY